MNYLSKILLGALIIAVFACLWFVLTQKNRGSSGCSGNCSGCGTPCSNKKNETER